MDRSSYSTSSESEAFPRRSTISHHSQFYGLPSESLIYQSSGKRAFPPSRDFAPRDTHAHSRSLGQAGQFDYQSSYNSVPVSAEDYGRYPNPSGHVSFPPARAPLGQPPRPVSGHREWESPGYISPDSYLRDPIPSKSPERSEYLVEMSKGHGVEKPRGIRYYSQRRPSNRDEFDGPHQLLDLPSPRTIAAQERELPHLPTNLDVSEQDQILSDVNARLSQCAFDFIAKYQFPIPLEPDKREVRVPADREWTEWVYLLKRLATKRRIPARVLYNGQIKQLVTVLENSLEMRHAAKNQSRPVKDDRNVLQLISAGTQVAKILKDASAMEYLDRLYVETERRIQERRNSRRVNFGSS
ncbi:hypothetical protein VTN02DRAFT_5685 [Thermoascus thermophilus]